MKHMLRTVGFGNSHSQKGKFGEHGDNEKEAVVKINMTGSDPRDRLAYCFYLTG